MNADHSPRHILKALRHFVFIFTLIVVATAYGIWASNTNEFPAPELKHLTEQFRAIFLNEVRNQMLSLPGSRQQIRFSGEQPISPGLIKVVGIEEGPANFIRVIDRKGQVVQEWRPDWFEIWPKDDWLPLDRRPVAQPGAEIHGSAIASNGDLIANFEHLSTVRINACGEVVWKLPNLGHHSVHIEESSTIWVGSENYFESGSTPFPGHKAPLKSWTLQQISPDGEILETIPVIEILMKNDLLGLVYMSSTSRETFVSGDTLHLNDIETFPDNLESEIFSPGDLMISLRNINSILVIDREDHSVKFRSSGRFLRQHDPDFISGDRILVYDNRNLEVQNNDPRRRSRILSVDARTGLVSDYFTKRRPAFFSWVLGKHQALENGNHLITSPLEGQVMEVTREGKEVWRYSNRVSDDHDGLLVEGAVLPVEMDSDFFLNARRRCGVDSTVEMKIPD